MRLGGQSVRPLREVVVAWGWKHREPRLVGFVIGRAHQQRKDALQFDVDLPLTRRRIALLRWIGPIEIARPSRRVNQYANVRIDSRHRLFYPPGERGTRAPVQSVERDSFEDQRVRARV